MGFSSHISICLTAIILTSSINEVTANEGNFVKITLHIFSGRPDPVWSIDQSNNNFHAILDRITNVHSTELTPRLGYKGFSVEVFSRNILSRSLFIGSCKEPDLETMLLDTVKDLPPIGDSEPLGHSLVQYVRQDLQNC